MSLLIANKRFAPLFITQFLGAMNDNIYKNALVILITYKNVSLLNMETEQVIAFAGGIFILPFFLFSSLAGRLSDRHPKDKIARLTKILEIIIMALACIALFVESYEVLMILLFLMGTQSAFFGPVKYSLLPEVLENDELVGGNSYLAGGTFLAILLGTVLGGTLAGLSNFAIILSLVLIITSLMGYIASLNIRPKKSIENVGNYKALTTFKLFKVIKNQKDILANLLGVSWFWFLGSAVLSLLPILAKDFFKGSETLATFFLTLFTVGMGSGSLFLGLFWKKRLEMGVVSLAALCMSVALFILFVSVFYLNNNIVGTSIGLFLLAAFGALFIIPQMTFIQKFSDKKILSQIIAANNILNAIFMVMGAVLLMGLYALGFNALEIVLILALLNFMLSFVFYAYHSETTLRLIAEILAHWLYRFKVVNRDNMPETGGAVVICNHVSFMDWLVLMAASPRPIRFVIDHNYYYAPSCAPMLPFWFKQAKLIPIATRRDNEAILNKAFEEISKNLEAGHLIGIFPEGGITRDGGPRPFQPGVTKIVSKNPVPIVPTAISGLWGGILSFWGGKLFKAPFKFRREVCVNFGNIVVASECDLKKLANLVNELRDDLDILS